MFRKQAVDQQKARPLLHQTDIELVHAATAANEAEMGVKNDQRDHAGPEGPRADGNQNAV